MAELPEERLSTYPPFTYVELDGFGPFTVTASRTRGAPLDLHYVLERAFPEHH